MKVSKKKWIRFRIISIAALFVLGLGTVLARAYQIQILDKERLTKIARAGYVGTIKLPPKRGTIYDRENHELAISVEVQSVYAHPNRVKDKVKTASYLSGVLGDKKKTILSRLEKDRSFIWIKRRIPPEMGKRMANLNLEGVGITTETRRYYPGKEVAAHLIGFAGIDNQGLEGLEKKYDDLLRGPAPSLIHMRDALGRPFAINRTDPSDRGMHDLILTIDKDIQYKAQEALEVAVKKAGAKAGHCIVVNPFTGEVLAIAVVPEFNPNIFSHYQPQQWRNRAITDTFEPGSTIKAFLLAAALEESMVQPYTIIDCEEGDYEIGGHVIHDTHQYDVLNVSDIVVYSSNIGAVKIGQQLGYRKFEKYLRKFGFGDKTGIQLVGERSGYVRPYKKAKTIDRATMYFGQGMSTTTLQLAMAMAAIANGGKLMRPYVVKAVVNDAGKVVKEMHPEVIRTVISQRTARKVANVLEGVVSEEGTGPQAAIPGFKVAGKTGTSQKVDPETKKYSKKKYVATFAGFAPVGQPRLVIIVVIDEPKGNYYGGTVAGPVFKELGLWSLNYLGVNPQTRLASKRIVDPDRKKRADSRTLKKRPQKIKDGLLPDFKGLGMREVLKTGKSLGLKVVLKGTGLAVKQEPVPGKPLKNMKILRVNFRPPT